jgi:tetratricopeptide (TPR) repeat protein
MKNFHEGFLLKISLLISVLFIFVVVNFGQKEQSLKINEESYNRRINDYKKIVFSKCSEIGYEYNCRKTEYTKIIESNPNDAAAYFIRGLDSSIVEPDQTISDLNKVLELDQNYMLAYIVVASAYSRKKDYDQAISKLNRAIELDSQFANAYTNRGFAYLQKGNVDKAFADYNKVIELKPKDDSGYVGLAMIYSQQLNYEKAIENYSKAIEISPYSWHTYFNRGYIYWEQGEKTKADADCQKAKELKHPQTKPRVSNYCSL